MKIGILGASGFIGYHLFSYLNEHGHEVLGTCNTHPQDHLRKFDLACDNFAVFDSCSHVVISSAITNIDRCCSDRKMSYLINVTRTIELINYLSGKGIITVFLSSDQVFDGTRGFYSEEDFTHPINHYGAFKEEVEQYISSRLSQFLTLRLGKTYSSNLAVKSMYQEIHDCLKNGQKVRAADNQVYNLSDVTFTCQSILQAILKGLNGLYNLAEERIMSRYDFACQIANIYGFDGNLIEPIDINAISLLEPRPLNTSLNVKKIATSFKDPLKSIY